MNDSYVIVHSEWDEERYDIELNLGGIQFIGNRDFHLKKTAVRVAKKIASDLGIEYRDSSK